MACELLVSYLVPNMGSKIDKRQQNCKVIKCNLCGDRDETINHIRSECSKLAQKEYKTSHDWLEKGILCEL